MRVVSRAADAVVVRLRHLDRHLDRRNKLCDIVHDDIAAALERRLACHADRHVRKDLLPRQRTIRRDQRAPADDCRQQRRRNQERLAPDYLRNHLAQLEERASVFRLSCRSAVHHERPSSFV